MLIFGREPAAVVAAVVAVLAVAGSLGLDWLSAGQATAIGGLLYMAVTAWATRPIAPALFTGIVYAAAGVYAEYFTALPEAQVMLVDTAVLAVMALLTRGQVSPVPIGAPAPAVRRDTSTT